jgi:hypothetical protein
MNYNFVDTDLIKINDELELKIEYIPDTDHKIFIIDNFLKNPEDLRDIASKQLFEKITENENGHPSWVSITNLKFNQITKTAKYITKNYYGASEEDKFKVLYQFNLFEGGTPCNYTSILPHTDNSFFAFQIYLNLPEECEGGTNFYKHISSDLDHNAEYFDPEFKRSDKYFELMEHLNEIEQNNFNTILESRQIDPEVWKNIHGIEMKYNRFVMYPSYVFHSAYIEKEWFQEIKRIGLVGFLK